MMKNRGRIALCMIFLVLSHGIASADLTIYTDRAAFEAQGDIVYNNAFEEYPWDTYTSFMEPFYEEGVTYYNDSEWHPIWIIGGGYSGMDANYIYATSDSALRGVIDMGMDCHLLGLDIAWISVGDPPVAIHVHIITNQGSYYPEVDMPEGTGESTFIGFVADPGETITQFTLSDDFWLFCQVMASHITLGHVEDTRAMSGTWSEIKASF